MKNVYCIRLTKPIETVPGVMFSGKGSNHLYVVASTIVAALAAVSEKYPGVEIRGMDVINYQGVPIVVGD